MQGQYIFLTDLSEFNFDDEFLSITGSARQVDKSFLAGGLGQVIYFDEMWKHCNPLTISAETYKIENIDIVHQSPSDVLYIVSSERSNFILAKKYSEGGTWELVSPVINTIFSSDVRKSNR